MSSIRTRPTASSRGLHQGVDVLQQNHPAARVESQIGAILPAQTQRPNEVGKVPFRKHPAVLPRKHFGLVQGHRRLHGGSPSLGSGEPIPALSDPQGR